MGIPDEFIKEIRESGYDQELLNPNIRELLKSDKEYDVNFPIFVESLLMPLLGLGLFVVYKRSKKKKRKFHASNPSTT